VAAISWEVDRAESAKAALYKASTTVAAHATNRRWRPKPTTVLFPNAQEYLGAGQFFLIGIVAWKTVCEEKALSIAPLVGQQQVLFTRVIASSGLDPI
jgi:hypothetical protein